MFDERSIRRTLVAIALTGLLAGSLAAALGRSQAATVIWAMGTVPVALGLLVSMIRDFAAGRVGVDAIAFVSMSAALALGETLAAAVVALMYAGGTMLEVMAVSRAELALKSLIDRAPRTAHRRRGGSVEDIDVEAIAVADRLVVHGGEIVPADGRVESVLAVLDESALTGEAMPVQRRRGESVRSGTINSGETFEFTATATAGESSYSGIVRMVAAAQTAKAPFMRVADRYAILLLPVAVLLAGAAWILSGDPLRGLAVLVAATPCPLILAAPVAFISGVSRAARQGILVKGGAALEALATVSTAIFDKTGTLTLGGARLIAVEAAEGYAQGDVLAFAASIEQASRHVVAVTIVEAARSRGLTLDYPERIRETMGSGLEGEIAGKRVRVGSYAFVAGQRQPEAWATRTLRRAAWRAALSVFVAVDGRLIGALILGDELRRDTPHAIERLRRLGISRVLMVTGDNGEAAQTIGAALDLDAVLADRIPADKVDAVATEQLHAPTVMVGDGINDAPALAAARVGIAMGARGATASSEAADVVILVDRLDSVPEAVAIARRTLAIARQSIVVGLGLSAVAMLLGAFGVLTPVAAAISQEGIDVAVILNALRALSPGAFRLRAQLPAASAHALFLEHKAMDPALDRLREIADALDSQTGAAAVALIAEASLLTSGNIVRHELADRTSVYPLLETYLTDSHGLAAMSRAHREILHRARLLDRLAAEARENGADHLLIRDAQRAIEAIESLVRIHNAQEDDIYQHATSPA